MADIKLFSLSKGKAKELSASPFDVEKSLQNLVETNMDSMLGVRFLASEHSTGKKHGGRIDSLGIDEDGCPVIVEYKRDKNDNVINQGLFYLDWLMDHQAEFKLLVIEKLGKEEADKIDWSGPRLLCIARDFSKYDEYAIKQINRNIELIRYRLYDEKFVVLEQAEHVTAALQQASTSGKTKPGGKTGNAKKKYTTYAELYESSDDETQQLATNVIEYIADLHDDVQVKEVAYYVAFKKLRNFGSLEVRPMYSRVLLFLKVDPDTVELVEGFTRDVRKVGHLGTGDLEITLHNNEEFDKVKHLIQVAYEGN